MSKEKFQEGEDYYYDSGMVVMTEKYHLKRGNCCGSKCKNCPYTPKYQKGNTITNSTILQEIITDKKK